MGSGKGKNKRVRNITNHLDNITEDDKKFWEQYYEIDGRGNITITNGVLRDLIPRNLTLAEYYLGSNNSNYTSEEMAYIIIEMLKDFISTKDRLSINNDYDEWGGTKESEKIAKLNKFMDLLDPVLLTFKIEENNDKNEIELSYNNKYFNAIKLDKESMSIYSQLYNYPVNDEKYTEQLVTIYSNIFLGYLQDIHKVI